MNEPDKKPKHADDAVDMPIDLTAAGHVKKLKCLSLQATCCEVENGVAFEFDNEGAWVVPLFELEKIVEYAKALKTHGR